MCASDGLYSRNRESVEIAVGPPNLKPQHGCRSQWPNESGHVSVMQEALVRTRPNLRLKSALVDASSLTQSRELMLRSDAVQGTLLVTGGDWGALERRSHQGTPRWPEPSLFL